MAPPPGASGATRMESLRAQYEAAMARETSREDDRRVLARKPTNNHARIVLPATLDFALILRSFCGDWALTKQQIMEWYCSGEVLYCIHLVNTNCFKPLSVQLRELFPRSITSNIKPGLDCRIADLAMKIAQTGLRIHQVESRAIFGMATYTERMYNACQDTFFSKQFPEEKPFPHEAGYLACARVILTAYQDLEKQYSTSTQGATLQTTKTFFGELVKSQLRRPATSEVRKAWTELVDYPTITESTSTSQSSEVEKNTHIFLPNHIGQPEVKDYVKNSPKTWNSWENFNVLTQYKFLLKDHGSHDKIPFEELAARLPGRNKNDCIQYFNHNKVDFGCAATEDLPFDRKTAPVSRMKTMFMNLEDQVMSLQTELATKMDEFEDSWAHAEEDFAQMKAEIAQKDERIAKRDKEIAELKAEIAALRVQPEGSSSTKRKRTV